MSGQSSDSMPIQCAELEVLDDNILENDEVFSIRLSSWTNQVNIINGSEDAKVIIREDNMDCKRIASLSCSMLIKPSVNKQLVSSMEETNYHSQESQVMQCIYNVITKISIG